MVGESWISFDNGVATVAAAHPLAPATIFYDREKALCLHEVSQALKEPFWEGRNIVQIRGAGMVIYTSTDLNAFVSFMHAGIVTKFRGTFISPDAADIVLARFAELFENGFRAPLGSEISLPIIEAEGKEPALREACRKIGLNTT